ncbi:hypothetical protein AnigIFM60653_009919 [Aspergillus niger]|nr:hypothetical protein AnigIFM50267_011797 [Aspergillus niger]GLA08388.1 hypothetical protein AnigIFM60653_009919 [Aspergillus niger]
MRLVSLLWLLPMSCGGSSCGPLNYRAEFGSSPAPSKIDVDPKFIKDTVTKVALTRFPVELKGIPTFEDCPSIENATPVRDYWITSYNWSDIQDELNAKYLPNFQHDVKLHFVHHRSDRPDAIPLLFLHGWPGSFLEVGHIIGQLTSPPNTSLPAFHVVAPSLPGIGFSPPPEHDGSGPIPMAHAFHVLMMQLGYSRYPTEGDRAAVANHTAPQGAINYISLIDYYVYYGSRYRYIQQSKPLQLAYGLGNSPLGHAMWMYEIMAGLVTTPNYWTLKDIITWSMTYSDSNRLYFTSPPSISNIKPPIALSEFPGDVTAGLPLSWAQRDGNVVVRYSHPQGGHFPATEVPDLLLADVWTYFGNKNLSNTAVFSEHARSVTGNAHLG